MYYFFISQGFPCSYCRYCRLKSFYFFSARRGMGRGRGRGRGLPASDAASIISTATSVGPQGVQPNPSQPTWNQQNVSHNPNTSVPLPDTTQFADMTITEQPTQSKSTSSSDSVPLETFRFNTTQKTPEHCKYCITFE